MKGVLHRLINAGAAGFAVGSTLGGLGNLRRGQPTDLLQKEPEETGPGTGFTLEGEPYGPETPGAPQQQPQHQPQHQYSQNCYT